MSTTVDQRVVEMRFDNKNFENNVRTSMSTLEKLKQSLHLTGATKGIENINTAAKKVDMSGLSRGAEQVGLKFNAMYTMADQALRNITNRVQAAAENMVRSLTTAPVGDGFKEYEMTLNAVQTTMAGTGKTAEEVEAQLKKLDEYADKTVYSTADMLNNLPKFTNAGVDLEVATKAMIGIANATAHAGGDASKASIAFYNLGQAIGTGYLTRMDYNSINNAGIATMEWKEQMVEAAIAQGTLTKVGEDAYKAGNKTLTLQQLFIDGLQEQWATTDVMVKVFGDYGDKTTEIGYKAYSAAQDVKTFSMMMDSLKATAGTGWKDTWQIVFGGLDEAKKFWTGITNVISDILGKMSDFRNGMLETALGSKWDKLTKKIEAAGFTTEQFTGKLTKVLEESGASVEELTKEYGSLKDAIAAGAVPVKAITKALKRLLGIEEDATDATNDITMSVEELEAVAKRVWRGEFGNGAERMQKLTEAGYDYATVQNKVNELMGVSYRHASKLTEEQLANADSLAKLSDEQLKAKGYTEDQIEALRELEKAADGADSSITDLINDLEKPSGRTLLLESFVNIWERIKDIFGLIGEAWTNIFGEKDAEDYADGIYGVIEKFHELTESMTISEEAANNFRTIMEGLFAGFQLTGTIASKSVVAIIKIADALLKLFGTDILGVASKIAEYIILFNDWVKNNTMFGSGTMQNKMAEVLFAIYEGVSKCVKAFLDLEKVQSIITKVKDLISDFFVDISGPIELFSLDGILLAIENFFTALESWIKGIDTAEDIGTYIFEGLKSAVTTAFDKLIGWIDGLNTFDNLGLNIIEGIALGMVKAVKFVITSVIDICNTIYDAFCEAFQTHSPSRLMMTFGGFLIAGLVLGLKDGLNTIPDLLQKLVEKCTNGVDWSKFSAVFWNISALFPGANILNLIASIGNSFAAFGGDSANNILSGLIGGLAKGAKVVIDAIIELANRLISGFKEAIDAHSPSRVFIAIGGFIIAGLLLGLKDGLTSVPDMLRNIANNCVEVIQNIDWKGVLVGGIAIAALLLMKRFADIMDTFSKPFGKFGGVLGALKDTITSFGAVSKAVAFDVKTRAIKQLAISIAIIVASIIAITMLVDSPEKLVAATVVILLIVGALAGLAWAMSQLGDASFKFEKGKGIKFDGLKQNLIAIGAAILMVGAVVALLGHMEIEELKQGFKGLTMALIEMLAFVGIMTLFSKLDPGDNVGKVGGLIFKVALAMGLMLLVVKMAGKLRPAELTKGIIFMAAYALFVKALVKATTMNSAMFVGKGGASATGQSIGKVGGMILAVTIAMGLMVALCKLVAKLSPDEMKKGAAFAGAFVIFIGALVMVTKVGKDHQIAAVAKIALSTSVALLLLVGMCKIAGALSVEEMVKGAIFAAAFLLFVKGLVKVTTIGSEQKIAKVAGTMIGLAIAVAALAGVCLLLQKTPWEGLAKGLVVVGVLSAFITGMLWAARGVNDLKGTLMWMAITIGMMVGIIALLMLVKDPKKLISPVLALGTLLVAYGFALKSLSGIKAEKGMIKSLISILAITVLLGGIVTGLSFLPNPDAALKATVALSTLLVAFAAAISLLGKTGEIPNSVSKILLNMTGVALAMGILLAAMSQFSNPAALIPSAVALGILLNAFSSSILILSKSSKNTTKAYNQLLGMTGVALALGILLAAMSQFSNPDALIPSAVALGILLNTFSSSILILSYSSKNTTKAYGILLEMTGVALALGILLAAMSQFSNPSALIPAATALGILLNAFASSMLILSLVKGISTDVTKSLIAMTAVAGLLAVVVWGLSQIKDTQTAMTNAITLSGLMAVLTGLMAAVSLVGKYTKSGDMTQGIIGLAAMAAPLWLFSKVLADMGDLTVAKENLLALTQTMIVMTALLPILALIGKFRIDDMATGILGLTAMAVPLWTFAKVAAGMTDISGATENLMSVAKTMVVMSIVLAAVSAVGQFLAAGIIPGLLGLVAVVLTIGALVAAIGWLVDGESGANLKRYIDQGIPVLIQLASGIGEMIGSFIGSIGERLGDTLVKIGGDIKKFMESIKGAAESAEGINPTSFDGALALIKALAAVAALAVGTTIADMFTGLFSGQSSMEKFQSDAIAFFTALSAIKEHMVDFELPSGFSGDSVVTLLKSLGAVSAAMVGTSIADLFTFMAGDEGTMEKFQTDAVNFFKAIKAIIPEMTGFEFPSDFNVEGLVQLLDCLKKVGSAMIGVSIADLFAQMAGDEGTMEKFKTDAVNFFRAIKAIAPEMTGFEFPADFNVDGLVTLLDALKQVAWAMTGVSLADLFAQMAGDEGAMEKFKTDGVLFFQAIKAIAGEMDGATLPENVSVEGLTGIFEAIKEVSKFMTGESWRDIWNNLVQGDGKGTTIDDFRNKAVGLFTALKDAGTAASEINMDAFTTGTTAISKIKTLIGNLVGIDYSGLEKFTGIGTGGIGADGPMHDVAVAIKDFADQVNNINVEAVDVAVTAAGKIRTLIARLVGLDASGIENFKAKAIGIAMKDYADQVNSIDAEVVNSSVTSAEKLKRLIASLVGLDNSGVDAFIVGPIGEGIKAYSNSVVGIDFDSVSASITSATRLKNFITGLVGLDGSGVGTYKAAIEELGSIQIGNIIQTFKASIPQLTTAGSDLFVAVTTGMRSKQAFLTNAVTDVLNRVKSSLSTAVTTFRTTGAEIMNNFASGIQAQRSSVITAISASISLTVSTIRLYYTSFYNAGSYLVDGISSGISDNAYKAVSAATTMVNAAIEAAKEAAGICSPSKVFYGLGEYCGMGLVNALTDYSSKVYTAGSEMADSARKGLNSAINKVIDGLNGDMDMQPTIRPVLDLSSVESGVGTINGMFNRGPSLGVTANLNAISSAMNNRIQNGSNDDVISAIDKLRGALGNTGNTYQINGITYDDGSNVSSAIGELVRAAKVERRI